jgi:hypothetical protein
MITFDAPRSKAQLARVVDPRGAALVYQKPQRVLTDLSLIRFPGRFVKLRSAASTRIVPG